MKDTLLKSILPALCTCLTNEKVQEELKKLGVLLPGLGIAASMANALVGAVAPSILSNFAASISYKKLKSILQDEHPNKLNHDLRKLLQDAAVRSVAFIEKLYLDKLENDSRLKEKDLEYILAAKSNLSKIKDWFSENLIKSEYFYEESMLQNGEDCLLKITNSLFDRPGVNENKVWSDLRNFFRQKLPSCFDLAFKEALKDNERGRISFQIWIWEDIHELVKSNSNQLNEIHTELKVLKSYHESSSVFADELNKSIIDFMPKFESFCTEVLGKLDEILISLYIVENNTKEILSILKNPKVISNLKPPSIQNVSKEIFIDASNEFYDSQYQYFKTLVEKLKKGNKICLTGIPGIGKTYLAKRLAYGLLSNNFPRYDIIWWIDADDKKIDNELIDLAQEIFKDEFISWRNDKIPEAEIIKLLMHKLQSNTYSWLIIFDNAKDYGNQQEIKEYSDKYLPKIENINSRILITSRNQAWESSNRKFEAYTINIWSKEDVKKYIEIPKNNFEIKVKNIDDVNIFDGLPLAVSIAKKFILLSKEKGRSNFTNFFNKWNDYKIKIVEDPSYFRSNSQKDEEMLSLLVTVGISYNILTNSTKEVINLLSCFAPDELPIETVFGNNIYILNSQNIANYNEFRNSIITLHSLSLSELNEKDELNELNSMHRLVQECIRIIQGKKILIKNYRIALSLLFKVFDNKTNNSLISHVDTLADALQNSNNDADLNILSDMGENEKKETLELFIKAGQYHFETGDIKSAENQYKSAIKIALNLQASDLINESSVTGLKKSLANILFLKGKISENEVTVLTNEISQYYERNKDTISLVAYQNDVVNKIFQRQCRFNECEKTLEKIENIVITHNQSIENDLYEYMVQTYVDNDSNKLAEKLSGIYHNLGSLYWTWGRPGDYEKSAEYFVKAIDFQAKFVSVLEDRLLTTNEPDIKDRLEKVLNNKNLYLNVSRMIYGAVLGLLGNFTDQWEEHQKAFFYFNSKIASEKRRYAYTAYYKLSYSWDRESLGKGLPKGFDENNLIEDIYRYDGVLVGYDEKYDVIKKIVRLRIASKNLNSLERDKLYAEATEAHDELWKQLEFMKYDKRYYDVDTCSVSAFLDYAQYLKGVDKDKARLVVKQARAIIDGIVYPRGPELDQLGNDLGMP